MSKILLVDDDPQALESTRKILELSSHTVTTASDGQQALDLVRATRSDRASPDRKIQGFELVITDVRMPRLGGLEFLRALSLCGESIPVILMTAFGKVEDAVWAMKLGAVDFLTKPFKRQALVSSVDAALKRSQARLRAPGGSARPAVGGDGSLAGASQVLVGSSAAMSGLKSTISRVAPTVATVLLNGESGTGKELVARQLHAESPRVSGRFIALNCAAVPEQLMESELFGFEKGAFTGATVAKEGLFEAADRGTLLLDEIGDMPLPLQAKLLRVLQEGEVRRLGATQSRKVDVRLIAATHRDLKESVRLGTFREDLLYRLDVITLRIPPLRERMEDIAELAGHFLGVSTQRHGKAVEGIAGEAMEVLLHHDWPGNVRELSNVIERAVVFSTGALIGVPELPEHLVTLVAAKENGEKRRSRPIAGSPAISVPLGTSLKDVEDLLIRKTLEATSGDKNMTAKLLGINERTIYRKLVDKKPQDEGSSGDG